MNIDGWESKDSKTLETNKIDNLRPADNWLLSKYGGKCIVDLLDKKSCNKKVFTEDLVGFRKFGIEGNTKEIAISLNKSLVALKLPLIAESWDICKIKIKDAKPNCIIIRHTKIFNFNNYKLFDKENLLNEDYQKVLKEKYSKRMLPKISINPKDFTPTVIPIKHSEIAIDENVTEKPNNEKLEKIIQEINKFIKEQKGTRGS